MDSESTKDKPKADEIESSELILENRLNFDTIDESIFDKTLKEIDQILINLERKINEEQGVPENDKILPQVKSVISKINIAKNELTNEENNLVKNNNLLKRIEELEKNINNSDKSIASSDDSKKDTISEFKDHPIDKNLLSIDESYYYEENNEKKKKNSLGFYSYLILTIVIFLTFYGALSILEETIILKYPTVEPYINYFYEIIEILKISIFGLIGFVVNII